ncbi:DUF3152 domain-containing protein [Jidongwangia harbinensis]|uniref:DUF3152 domain-containing protein n=1 Tax=Jidongwangia harbinensis TaxID=2878561 RepID=UPI001CD94294|nr:DUF3152 domain-containing protein [Jidongwangia harbinensis]MCA2214108.1 DUF3152 domain-containing protein [Jidongwangia harbinensis]
MSVRRCIAGAVLGAITLSGCGTAASGTVAPVVPSKSPARSSPKPKPKPVRVTYPADGGGAFAAAKGERAPQGRGRVLRYRVLVEKDIKGIKPAAFASTVRATLADSRGWTASGDVSFRRVGRDEVRDFTIYLVTPGTRDELCQGGRDGYTSCRNGDRVVLNVARWVKGVPRYGAPLSVYRQYLVNHEVGHRLGNGHEKCPDKGGPAPVMQQQTLGLHGCRANPWPYLDGERLRGASGVYDDPVPEPDRGVA